MFSEEINYFNDFLRQTPETGLRAFSDLMQVRTSLLTTNNPTIKKIYKYLDLLYPVITDRNAPSLFVPYIRMTCRFFDADLVKKFIATPTDQEVLDAVSEQIILIAAANGTDPFTEEPYTPSELQFFLAKQLPYYTHDRMLATLRLTMMGQNGLENLPILLTILGETATNYNAVPPEEFDWESAFVWAAMLHTVWFYFSALQTADQEMLIKYFFYQSIVAGVPVREKLLEMFANDTAGGANQKWIYSLLSQSLELVPTTTNGSKLKPFSFVWGQVAGVLLSDSLSALAEDEQARKLYVNQEGKEAYAPWIREMFHVVRLLQKGKL